jgi:hypothetical protein
MEKHPLLYNKEALWEAIQQEMEATPKELCRILVESMPHRIQAIIKEKGGSTKY